MTHHHHDTGEAHPVAHIVPSLLRMSDYELEAMGRLTQPLVYDRATDTFRAVEWEAAFVRIGVDGIEALGIEGGGAAYDPVNLVAFGQQQFREKRAVLSGNSGNESLFHDEITV